MKFAIISDTHLGPLDRGFFKGVQRKLSEKTLELINVFIERMNNEVKPEFVMHLGDLCEDISDKEIDKQNIETVVKEFRNLNMQIYFISGNHDMRTLGNEELAKIFGYKSLNYSFDFGDYKFLTLHFEIIGSHKDDIFDIRSIIPKESVEWLKKILSESDKPVILFTHYSLADQNVNGNFWFENAENMCLISNRSEIRKLLEDSGKVKMVVNSHLHWNNMTMHNGIPYITIPSIIENYRNNGEASNSFAIVDVDKKSIDFKVVGNESANYKFTF